MRFLIDSVSFNTQPPKGGWKTLIQAESSLLVSTHSRLKAAGLRRLNIPDKAVVSTHSRLKVAGTFPAM